MDTNNKKRLRWGSLLQISLIILVVSQSTFSRDLYVSIAGNDLNTGTKELPFATLQKAIGESQKIAGKETVTIWVGEGTYYISETLLFDASFSGTNENPFTITSLPGASVTVKGSKLLDGLQWKEYQHGIYVSKLPEKLCQ